MGALVGALITLVAHPVSRRVLLGSSSWSSVSQMHDEITGNGLRHNPPESIPEVSEWVLAACSRIRRRDPLSPGELRSVTSLLLLAQKKEPTNAFWFQTLAYFLESAGNPDDAEAAWVRGSKCTLYNDYQSVNLGGGVQRRWQRRGTSAWEAAYAYHLRNLDGIGLASAYARSLLARADYDSPLGIQRRLATIKNFDLALKGARSIALGSTAADLVELAAYPPSLNQTTRPKTLHLGRVRVINRMRSMGLSYEIADVTRIFENNEGWKVLTSRVDTVEQMEQNGLIAVLIATIPNLFFLVGLLGLLICGLSVLIDKTQTQACWDSRKVGAVAVLCSLGAFLATDLWLAAISTLTAVMFLWASPNIQRKIPEESFGPLFEIVCFGFAMLAGLFLMLGFFGKTAPVLALSNWLPSRHEITMFSQTGISLAVLSVVMFLIAMPMWSFVRRHSTPWVFAHGFRIFSRSLAWTGFVAAIVTTPIALALERNSIDVLDKLLRNEPIYYLGQ